MVSFSSWNGDKLHGNRYLLTDVLKGELGFDGFLVSDWDGDRPATRRLLSRTSRPSINAGLDMIMVPYDYPRFIATLTAAVERGDVPQSAHRRRRAPHPAVKLLMGLFERPFVDAGGAAGTRLAARTARWRARPCAESLVLLTNRQRTLPLAKSTPRLFVAGAAADDIGRQCGGWTIEWQGGTGAITPGTTILEGIRRVVGQGARVDYRRDGRFDDLTDPQGRPLVAEVGVAVVGEEPYAEGFGDSAELALPTEERAAVARLRARCARLVVVLIAGRPVVLGDLLADADAVIVAWLPGSEGQGIADALYGDYPFRGRLPYAWPRSARQLPLGYATPLTSGCDGPLFPRGYGLTTETPAPPLPACPPP